MENDDEGMTTDEFIEYCWDFYRPMGLYGYFFDNSLRKSELVLAVKLRKMQGNYAADSFDREAVRDIILQARGLPVGGV